MSQAKLHQPVEHAIERNPIKRAVPKRKFNLAMRQRRGSAAQQFQNTHSRRRSARARAADLLGDGIDTRRVRGWQDSSQRHKRNKQWKLRTITP